MSIRIASFTDFSFDGPYLAQLEAALYRHAEDIDVLHLMADAPAWQPRAAAYLFDAVARTTPLDCHYIAVVDPGVGGEREALAVNADGYWLVGPDNGLLVPYARRAKRAAWYRIAWKPEHLSASFHGRDLFAPVIAKLATGRPVECRPVEVEQVVGLDWPEVLSEVIYVDHFGNLITGLDGSRINVNDVHTVNGRMVQYAATFSDVSPKEFFWYVNSLGLIEIAVNQGHAATVLNADVGTAVTLVE